MWRNKMSESERNPDDSTSGTTPHRRPRLMDRAMRERWAIPGSLRLPLVERLVQIVRDPEAPHRSRISVLLANVATPQTLTITHTLWAMLGVLPPGRVQRPHRHQSVALDLITECAPGCYSLVGTQLGSDGAIIDPIRVDWEPAGAFVTPPGHWHSHHNESGRPAYLVPIQDAGLHTYLRSLDIRFSVAGD